MTRRRGGLGHAIVGGRRVSTATAFAPSDISGMRVWGKADTLALNDNDLVATMADSGSFGYTFTAAGAARPTFKTNIANGLPGLLFDGAGNKLRNADVPAQGVGAFSFYVVLKAVNTGGYRNAWTLGTAALNKACFLSTNGDVIEYGLYGGAFLSTTTPFGTTLVRTVLVRYDGTTFYSYRDGVATTPATATSPAFNLDTNGLSIGSDFGQNWWGYIFEWGMYDGMITVDDVASIQAYVAAKYAL